ncbi:lipase maturation factor 2 [Diachasma alloeum]|uniref:lipase maturation factor 2 n=1 Tax=Diachasma alloeum TaxID=454923 RepID=UPI00073814DD|nr:lipase maturation factor 2 [Diachasma alloeum]
MVEVRYTRNLFLRGVCIIYLFAFLSFYVQIPGLFGDNGVLPARTQVDLKGRGSLWHKLNHKPTVLWFASYLGLNVEYMMDLVAITGAVISFLGFISQKLCIAPVFMLLWTLYYSLFQVGQVFVQNNWDTLLLEAGFLCVLIAPFYVSVRGSTSTPSDSVTFWTIRWMLFRYMFSCSAMKLASRCPVWWNLDALSHHFETQCLPAPLGWYAHHLPSWFLRLNTLLAVVFELVIPLLFFFPNRRVRITAYYIQMFLQIHIITTGNWNFRDFLVICGLIALLDDQFFYKKKSKKGASAITQILSTLVCITVYSAVIYGTIQIFNVKFADNWTITSEIGFTYEQFDQFLARGLPLAIYIGLASLGFTVADAITHSILSNKPTTTRLFTFLTTTLYTIAVCFLFAMSAVSFSSLHPSQNATVPIQLCSLHSKINSLHIVNGPKDFALFPKMTGVNGRPEIIIEGSNSIEGPWKEYEFLYKPGNVNNSLPFVAPHTPRLDWQMWWAAQGTYHQNPWLMSLTYRLLTGQKEVTSLLNNVEKPFGNSPPKYIKATLYHYHFAPWRKSLNKQSWWTREKVGEYFPIFSRDHPPLLEYLSKMKILKDEKVVAVTNEVLKSLLGAIRAVVNKIEASLLLWSVFTAGCAIIMTGNSSGRK